MLPSYLELLLKQENIDMTKIVVLPLGVLARNMARKLKITENEKYTLDDLKNYEITKKHEK